MAELIIRTDRKSFVVELGPNDNYDRVLRIMRAAVLQVNDVVAELYEGAVMPARVSELERKNYGA